MGLRRPHVGKTVNATDCTGCAACHSICPANAVSMQPDKKGFLCPCVDENACVSCGKCVQSCPVMSSSPDSVLTPVMHAYAAYSRNEDTRYLSTSGGLFTELATVVLLEGGAVFGAAYDKDNQIAHMLVEDIGDLPRLRQSKYAQSNKKGTYLEARRLLDAGRKVLYAAAPCEIAALKTLVGDPANLFTVDFLCLGCNSPLVYRKYLESLERRAGSRVAKVWFKNKEISWNQFSTRVDFDNGSVYREDRDTDGFMRGYIVHPLYVRECCEHCHFKGTPHGSDVTLGDFWGVERILPDIDTSHGVSVVFANTARGVGLFEGVASRLVWNEVPFEQTLTRANMNALTRCVKLDSRSERFYADLVAHGFDYAIRRNASDPFLLRAKRLIRKILSRGGV
ncbi:Coenzyme F420 hydrogenase/dehydrogenase, beta subunit C-terminal domain [Adlercreutzia sp. ZJ141]|uniref:Coenzyme F420 hydrogenase/dehydrogenase, beta subunit C-terminal domain n=1 Tax=Adlercreutzia sp. ZJ141 TaxID=2709406 RepID=UPI0013EADD92|nr:Coenzyme F420 hydrogenase/dehydrogenase, beta subunit C-terminal domain [Adlercreutzia sp. ZJ141]